MPFKPSQLKKKKKKRKIGPSWERCPTPCGLRGGCHVAHRTTPSKPWAGPLRGSSVGATRPGAPCAAPEGRVHGQWVSARRPAGLADRAGRSRRRISPAGLGIRATRAGGCSELGPAVRERPVERCGANACSRGSGFLCARPGGVTCVGEASL